MCVCVFFGWIYRGSWSVFWIRKQVLTRKHWACTNVLFLENYYLRREIFFFLGFFFLGIFFFEVDLNLEWVYLDFGSFSRCARWGYGFLLGVWDFLFFFLEIGKWFFFFFLVWFWFFFYCFRVVYLLGNFLLMGLKLCWMGFVMG